MLVVYEKYRSDLGGKVDHEHTFALCLSAIMPALMGAVTPLATVYICTRID